MKEDLSVAESPEVGTQSKGYSIEEAIENLKEATQLKLEEFLVGGFSRSLLTTSEGPLYA